jgi:hypothetical protein
MKKRIFTAIFLILTAVLLTSSPARASSVTAIENLMKESMYDALRLEGIGEQLAWRISESYVFMGTVMINKVQFEENGDGDDIRDRASSTGQALGAALAASYMQYGGDALQETASVMMLSTRAGMTPETASYVFAILSRNGYGLDALVGVMREASEIVRGLKPNDGGASIRDQISGMALTRTPPDELRYTILSAAEREKERQRQLLAQKEMERIKRDSRGSDGERSASSSGRGGGAPSGGGSSGNNAGGNASAASAGRGNASGSSENDSSSGASAGDNASGSGSSGSDSASGSDGASSGGNSGNSGGASSGGNSGNSGGESASDSGGSQGGNDSDSGESDQTSK